MLAALQQRVDEALSGTKAVELEVARTLLDDCDNSKTGGAGEAREKFTAAVVDLRKAVDVASGWHERVRAGLLAGMTAQGLGNFLNEYEKDVSFEVLLVQLLQAEQQFLAQYAANEPAPAKRPRRGKSVAKKQDTGNVQVEKGDLCWAKQASLPFWPATMLASTTTNSTQKYDPMIPDEAVTTLGVVGVLITRVSYLICACLFCSGQVIACVSCNSHVRCGTVDTDSTKCG